MLRPVKTPPGLSTSPPCSGESRKIANQQSDLPDALKLKEAEFGAEQRRLANFVDFVGEGRGSQALAKALVETELRAEQLTNSG